MISTGSLISKLMKREWRGGELGRRSLGRREKLWKMRSGANWGRPAFLRVCSLYPFFLTCCHWRPLLHRTHLLFAKGIYLYVHSTAVTNSVTNSDKLIASLHLRSGNDLLHTSLSLLYQTLSLSRIHYGTLSWRCPTGHADWISSSNKYRV